ARKSESCKARAFPLHWAQEKSRLDFWSKRLAPQVVLASIDGWVMLLNGSHVQQSRCHLNLTLEISRQFDSALLYRHLQASSAGNPLSRLPSRLQKRHHNCQRTDERREAVSNVARDSANRSRSDGFNPPPTTSGPSPGQLASDGFVLTDDLTGMFLPGRWLLTSRATNRCNTLAASLSDHQTQDSRPKTPDLRYRTQDSRLLEYRLQISDPLVVEVIDPAIAFESAFSAAESDFLVFLIPIV